MFNLGLGELILIGVIALIFIGPKELPEVAKTLARFINEMRRSLNEVKQTIIDTQVSALRNPDPPSEVPIVTDHVVADSQSEAPHDPLHDHDHDHDHHNDPNHDSHYNYDHNHDHDHDPDHSPEYGHDHDPQNRASQGHGDEAAPAAPPGMEEELKIAKKTSENDNE
jgi:Tat protein translocase TatB subunit